jgi:PHD/YefM family antitoxin component YafN of YafNO toxin-antitoxin module
MEVITPTNFRKDIFRIIKGIVQEKKTVEITINSEKGFNDGVVVIDKEKYNQLKELEYLEKTGTLDTVMDRMRNSNEDDFVDL